MEQQARGTRFVREGAKLHAGDRQPMCGQVQRRTPGAILYFARTPDSVTCKRCRSAFVKAAVA